MRLWRHLSNKQLDGYKFRHQTEIDPAIADFFCPQKALVVEVDGETHTPEGDAAATPGWPGTALPLFASRMTRS
jgi:very-short-patch-repair endonuclease